MSAFSPEEEAQRGHAKKGKTWRGRRSKGKGPKPDHMAEANKHIEHAKQDPTPKGTTAHLFRALSHLKKAAREAPERPAENAV